ncbi:MAG: hypothetical protein ACREN5_17405, partial [Gemmatimonadales bacterium]
AVPDSSMVIRPLADLAGLGSAMPTARMHREEFFAKLAPLDEERLKKALWNLYWRGSAAMRARVEAEIDPGERQRRQHLEKEPVDPHWVLGEVREFVGLARSGAYIGGDRRIARGERTRWRFTFRRLVSDAQSALQAQDVAPAVAAVEALIDLACETREYDYFRSQDPLEAAQVVVSEVVAVLWGKVRDQYGFAEFAHRVAPQLIRWESKYGWTRSGWDGVSVKETSLASVLAQMLRVTDMWVVFADCYFDALDQVARDDGLKPKQPWRRTCRERKERAANLAEWHLLLIDRLMGSEAEDRLDRLVSHPALGGPELTFLRARLARERGDLVSARDLVHESLQTLPGHPRFLDFATEIGAPLPPRAQQAKRSLVVNEGRFEVASPGSG